MATPPCSRWWPSINVRIRLRGTNAHQLLTDVPGAPRPLIRSGLSMYGIWSRSGGPGSTASSCLTAIAEPSWAPAVSTAKSFPASSKSAPRRSPSGARLRPSSAIMSGCVWRRTPAYNSWVSAGRPLPGGTPGKISPKGALPSRAECSMPMWLAAPIARWSISSMRSSSRTASFGAIGRINARMPRAGSIIYRQRSFWATPGAARSNRSASD
jgi:hypothetical protein